MVIWDAVQQMQLRGMRKRASSDAEFALMRDRMQEERVDSVATRVDAAHDMVEALWEVLVAKLGCTEDDLVAALEVIEQRKLELNAIVPCAQCGAAMKRSDHHCQFCGAQPPGPPPPAIGRFEF